MMKPVLEPPAFERAGASFTAFLRRERTFDWNWHYHPELELTWIRRGHGRRVVGDHAAAYRAGDLVLLGAHLPHTWISDPHSRTNDALVVQFRALPATLLDGPEFRAVRDLLVRAEAGVQFSAPGRWKGDILRLARTRGLAGWLLLLGILGRLAEARTSRTLVSTSYRHERSDRLASRMERIVVYIEKNCRRELPLAEVARVAGITPGAFSRHFRRMTGQTFVRYRAACRVRLACRLLVETDHSITWIAGECGFDNLAGFNRSFRERQAMAPREFRRRHGRPGMAEGG